jgi:Protein of unknown function (DUF1501)
MTDVNTSYRAEMTRRALLARGGMACLPAGLVSLTGRPLDARPSDISTKAARPIRSCILVFFYGGPSHIDTFDPKPLAPAEVRGEYQTIETVVPGIRVGQHLVGAAQIMDRLALVRSVHHPMRNHNSAAAEALTGRTPVSGDLELLADEGRSFPTLGSTISYALGPKAHVLPYVALPHTMYNVVQLPGQTPGILGGAFDRFQVQGNPDSSDFRITALAPPEGRTAADVALRRRLLSEMNAAQWTGARKSASDASGAAPLLVEDPVSQMSVHQQRVFELLSSPAVHKSFDLSQETPATRERYGRGMLGQSLLLARRLVEGGVNFVSVFDGAHNGQEANWDSHEKIFPRHGQLIPPADRGLAALVEDLAARDLLEQTLVVAMGEFGRTPKINRLAGRDHWPDCYTVVMAGGGIQGGTVHGASDAIGGYPDRDGVLPADLAATVLWRFGIDPASEMIDPAGRPFRLAEGRPLESLFG